MQNGISNDNTLNKLIMLFVFDKMETAMTETTIMDLCFYHNKWFDYANCKLTLQDVVANGFVYASKPIGKDTEVLYDLTTDGRICLHHFYTRIPSTLRQVIANDIKKRRIDYRRRQDYVANYTKCPDGSYDVTLRIDEATKTSLEIRINVMSRSKANLIEMTWQKKAPMTYAKLEELLIE